MSASGHGSGLDWCYRTTGGVWYTFRVALHFTTSRGLDTRHRKPAKGLAVATCCVVRHIDAELS
jgi:hypothetical protein